MPIELLSYFQEVPMSCNELGYTQVGTIKTTVRRDTAWANVDFHTSRQEGLPVHAATI